MSQIIEKISEISDLDHLQGCTTRQIKDAQQELGLIFPEEYVDYVKEFGAISFYGTEWTGLNIKGYLNTIEATKQEKSVNSTFPEGFFVLEDIGIDAQIMIVNEKGNVFLLKRDHKELICESLYEYLVICLERGK